MSQQASETQGVQVVSHSPSETARLTVGGKALDLPVVAGTEQEKGVDISKLRDQTGYVTLDPGYGNTGACTSSITFLDGERGILRYRGYPIEELAENATYSEVAYLLVYGDLPSKRELDHFTARLAEKSVLPPALEMVCNTFMTAQLILDLGSFEFKGKQSWQLCASCFNGVLRICALDRHYSNIAAGGHEEQLGPGPRIDDFMEQLSQIALPSLEVRGLIAALLAVLPGDAPTRLTHRPDHSK